MIQLKIKRDTNGNKTLLVKAGSARGFSIQTNGKLPFANRSSTEILTNQPDVRRAVLIELCAYIGAHGTDRQNKALRAA